MSWFDATRARLRFLFGRRASEARMRNEIDFHIEMETARLMREQQLDAQEARRRALVAFGGVERHKEELRDGRGLAWLGGLSLDLKLGLRMLARYPGLTIVGVVGIAVAVAISATAFRIFDAVINPTLPLDDDERIVAVENVDTRGAEARGTHLHALQTWRESLTAVRELGAQRTVERNLIAAGGRTEPVRIAEMTASGFRIARVAPLLGRYVMEEDERQGAEPVAVIGHSLWQHRFGGDSGVIGRTMQLGATAHRVIGVMPEGFAFPVNNRVWTPLRLDPSGFDRGEAPSIDVFGRLAPGATLEQAQLQVATIGERLAAEHPVTYEHIRPRVMRYAHAFIDVEESMAYRMAVLFVNLLLVVIGTNVAILVFARTASRTSEIAVRTALGASRSRIVAQFFAEALVLSSLAAAVGIVFARAILLQIDDFVSGMGGEQMPFWMSFELSPSMILYAAGLAVLGAAIVGVAPALKATGRRVTEGLQQLGMHGSSLRLGRTWTVLIVTQVALAVAVLPVGMYGLDMWIRYGLTDSSPAVREFLSATLHLDREGVGTDDPAASDSAFVVRYAALQADLISQLEADPSVAHIVLMTGEPTIRIEVDEVTLPARDSMPAGARVLGEASLRRVEPDYFGAFDIPILAGRGFTSADLAGDASPVIVNRAFSLKVLGGGDPIGRRVRRMVSDEALQAGAQRAPWLEIVGVASDFPKAADPTFIRPRMFQPMRAGEVYPVTMAVRVRGEAPADYFGRLRQLTVAIDPMLRLRDLATYEDVVRQNLAPFRIAFIAVAALALSIILLSSAGIYALMSFTVTKRRREIGIRTALGAGPRRVLVSILSKAFAQISIGITVGVGLAALVNQTTGGDMLGGKEAVVLPAVAALMLLVGAIAAVGPARRGLSIQPTEALRPD